MATLKSRIEALEEAAGMRAVRIIWDEAGIDVKAVIAGMVARGEAAADDRFLAVSWSSGPEQPMNPDAFAPNVGPKPSPSPANDWE